MKKSNNFQHGMSGTRIYNIWSNMIRRCKSVKNNRYKNYGGRGIKVCDQWQKFSKFYHDMADSYKKNLTIDRINVNGNYCKENCRWSTNKEQQNNRRNNTVITFQGKTLTLTQWAEITGISLTTLSMRKNFYKWSDEKTLTQKVVDNDKVRNKMRKMLKDGMRIRDIAKKLGVHRNRVCYLIYTPSFTEKSKYMAERRAEKSRLEKLFIGKERL